jgi:two-component system OmpR family sensor kinase/two-component system sensor histidine kinase BaeS
MRNSLVFRLMGAFLLVIGIGAIVISALTSRAMREAFFLYTTRSGQVWAQRLALDLSAFYAQNQSWSGVSAFLQPGQEMQMSPGMMGNGMGQGRGNGPGRQATSAGMAAGMGQRLILADENNIVISDTANELAGVRLSASELGKGAAIIVGDTQVGTILVTPSDLSGANAPAQEFLASVNNAIISSTAVAGVIALLLGALLFLQITSPLRRLEKAAAAIAAGDLSQRVVVGSHDEIGKLGLAFNHMAESLASGESQRRQMGADVAHELRTPLAAIQGTLEGMQDGILPLDEEQVSVLYSETLLLNRLVADLKLLSLAEAGQLKLERRETNLPGLVRQVVERAKPQQRRRMFTW